MSCASAEFTYDWLNPIALGKAKIVCNFGLSECSRVDMKRNLIAHMQKRKMHIHVVGSESSLFTYIRELN